MEVSNRESTTTIRVTHASSCINIHHLDHMFHPIFTHQLFENERIQGYEPMNNTEYNKSNSNTNSCEDISNSISSIKNSRQGSSSSITTRKIFLSIDINLSPCCRSCEVDFHVSKKRDFRNTNTSIKKRYPPLSSLAPIPKKNRSSKKNNGTSDDDSSYYVDAYSSSSSSNMSSSSPEKEEGEEDTVAPQDSSLSSITTRNQTTLTEISEIINKALPHRISTTGLPTSPSNDEHKQRQQQRVIITRRKKRKVEEACANLDEDYLAYPLGQVLHEYDKHDSSYVLSLADGQDKEVLTYHNEVQNVSLWFIETADAVDVSCNKEGQWKILYLFRKHPITTAATKKNNRNNKYKYSFVGYMTLFYFYSPFKKPLSGYVARICQIFILPSYQRGGHGTTMMLTLYSYIHQQKNIVEITVEDPAPSCAALRDYIDFELFKYCHSANTSRSSSTSSTSTIFSFFPLSSSSINTNSTIISFKHDAINDYSPLSEKEARRHASTLKISLKQFHRVYEMYKLTILHSIYSKIRCGNNNNSTMMKKRDDIMKQYRLFVKKRLVKLYSEELDEWKDDATVRKERLSLMFDEVFRYYCSICKVVF